MSSVVVHAGRVPHLGRTALRLELALPNPKAKSPLHQIVLVDCSGSMTPVIDEVRNDVLNLVKETQSDDYLSIVVFSGHDRARLIAGPTRCDPQGTTLLAKAVATHVRILDTTVFSEPLALVLETVTTYGATPLAQHAALLFTDGCAVPTKWSKAQEQEKAWNLGRALAARQVRLDILGYGVWYDHAFLTMLQRENGSAGTYRHVSEVDDLPATFKSIRADLTKADARAWSVVLFDGDTDLLIEGHAWRTTPDTVALQLGEAFEGLGVHEETLVIWVEPDGSCGQKAPANLTVRLTLSGADILLETFPVAPLTDALIAEYLQVRATDATTRGATGEAAELLTAIGAEKEADDVGQAYSERERREIGDRMRRMFRDRKFIGKGLAPVGPAHCVLNILRALIEGEGNVVYLGKGAYKRSGELTSDPRVLHPPHGRTLKVTGYASHANRFNFSIRALKDVKVLPEDLKGAPVDAQIWRTYNVILDGNLWLPQLEAVLDASTFALLQEADVLVDVAAGDAQVASRTYTIDLRRVRLISKTWAQPANLGLVPLLVEEADLEVKQTALNARIKAIGKPEREFEGDLYFPKEAKVEGRIQEFYDADCVEIRLMGYKGVSFDAESLLDLGVAMREVKAVRARLITVRWLIRSITFAMSAAKSTVIAWGEPTTTTKGKVPKEERLASFAGQTLKKVSWTETEVCS